MNTLPKNTSDTHNNVESITNINIFDLTPSTGILTGSQDNTMPLSILESKKSTQMCETKCITSSIDMKNDNKSENENKEKVKDNKTEIELNNEINKNDEQSLMDETL